MNPLSPLGWLYGLAADTRNTLYDRGILKTHSLGAPSISIGNLTTGGTGKTPLVALVARIVADGGEKVCILTRGHGRKNVSDRVLVSDGAAVLCDARVGGDEPVELAYKLLGKAAVIADRDRVSAAAWAIANLRSGIFVLDDAFQHRRAARDLDIVCIDSTNPFGNGEILPAGTLREKAGNVLRADAIVITRTDLVKDVESIEKLVLSLDQKAKIFGSSNKITRIVELGMLTDNSNDYKKPKELTHAGFAFCGLGNPSNFFRQLEMEGIELAGRKTFPDHYFYSLVDLKEIRKKALSAGATYLITTVKDAVRLTQFRIDMPCYVAEIATVMDDSAGFRELIFSSAVPSYRPSKMHGQRERTPTNI